MKYLWVIVFAVLVILIGITYYLSSTKKMIEYREVGIINQTLGFTNDIHFITSKDDIILEKYKIDISGIDLSRNTIVLTEGRQLKELSFQKNSLFGLKSHFVNVTLDKNLKGNTLYMYTIDRMVIYLDERYENGGIKYE